MSVGVKGVPRDLIVAYHFLGNALKNLEQLNKSIYQATINCHNLDQITPFKDVTDCISSLSSLLVEVRKQVVKSIEQCEFEEPEKENPAV